MTENSKHIPVALEMRDESNQWDVLIESQSEDIDHPSFHRDDLEEVALTTGYDRKKKKPDDDLDFDEDSSESEQEDDDDELSGSFRDDEHSVIDIADETEKRVKKTLFYAILNACGMIFLITLIGRLVERCSGQGSSNDGEDEVGEALGNSMVHVGRDSIAEGGRSSIYANQQAV